MLRLRLNKCNSGRFASHNNEKGVGLFLHQHKGSIRRHARLHEEAPGSRQSPRRGLAVNSWVGGKGRPPREMETAPRERSRFPTQGRFSIPDSDSLHADLCSVGDKYMSDGKLLLEAKEDMKKRGMPSPDEGDAVGLYFGAEWLTVPVLIKLQS